MRYFHCLATALFLAGLFAANATAKECQAVELHGYEVYDKLVCSGISLMEKHEFREAVKAFEKASQISLHEFPNFKLLPRLALAHFYLGDTEKALQTLGKAELSLMVLARMVRCQEKNDRYSLVWNSGDAPQKVNSSYHDEVAGIMCGTAYEYIYEAHELETVVYDASLVQEFLKAKEAIKGDNRR